jgi:hypothetical protein
MFDFIFHSPSFCQQIHEGTDTERSNVTVEHSMCYMLCLHRPFNKGNNQTRLQYIRATKPTNSVKSTSHSEQSLKSSSNRTVVVIY